MLITTTSVQVWRADETGDPFEDAPRVMIHGAVPAHIETAAVRIAQLEEDAIQPINAALLVDPTPEMKQNDLIIDNLTNTAYTVQWVRHRTGLGLDHQRCGLFSKKLG